MNEQERERRRKIVMLAKRREILDRLAWYERKSKGAPSIIALWLAVGLVIGMALLLSGCTPIDPPAPQPTGPDQHARGLWSWSLAIQPSNPTPKPPDPPTPSDICPNCRGTGKLGDGVVSVTCPVCNGTGKRVTDEPDEAPDEPEQPEHPETKPEPVEQPKPEPKQPDAAKNNEQNYGRRRLLPRIFQ